MSISRLDISYSTTLRRHVWKRDIRGWKGVGWGRCRRVKVWRVQIKGTIKAKGRTMIRNPADIWFRRWKASSDWTGTRWQAEIKHNTKVSSPCCCSEVVTCHRVSLTPAGSYWGAANLPLPQRWPEILPYWGHWETGTRPSCQPATEKKKNSLPKKLNKCNSPRAKQVSCLPC